MNLSLSSTIPLLPRAGRRCGVAVWAAMLLLLGGCSIPIPQAEKDPTRYYVLAASTAGTPQASAPVIHLRNVELAHYLTGRAMVVRRGGNEIEFREFARWGESLDVGITRVLREELIARGAARAVTTTGARREPGPEVNLSIRVLGCEGETNGEVVFRAVWEVSGKDANGGQPQSGDFRAAGLRWDGRHEASLAAAISQAVASLAGEIASALKK